MSLYVCVYVFLYECESVSFCVYVSVVWVIVYLCDCLCDFEFESFICASVCESEFV